MFNMETENLVYIYFFLKWRYPVVFLGPKMRKKCIEVTEVDWGIFQP